MELKNQPAFYFPPANGRYEVNAGFKRLDTNFGNGEIDQQFFQFDRTFQNYRDNKLACRNERLSKYYVERDFYNGVRERIYQFLINQLCSEHPDKFIKQQGNGYFSVECLVTGEQLVFSDNYNLVDTAGLKSKIPYTSTLDAIANQIQEDVSIVQIRPDATDYISALHLCSPNHWAAEDKIGTSFFATHRPVPHIERINQQSYGLLKAVLDKGPYVRFAWGLSTDTQLNHHPQPPTGVNDLVWQGRRFDPDFPELWLRAERQTLTGFKDVNAILFTIRTYFYRITDLKTNNIEMKSLISAIESMSSKSLEYKGLHQSRNDILNWLNSI